MKINFYLIITMLCTSAYLQASQVAQKKAAQHRKQATLLELEMIDDSLHGCLTEEALQQYLQQHADINAQDRNGGTALIWAAWNDRNIIVKLLIAAGADLNAQDNHDFTALLGAALRGHNNMVQLLIAEGADQTIVNKKDRKIARDYANNEAAFDKAVAAGLLARQQQAKKIIAEQITHIPGLQDIIMGYAYGPSPLDLPPAQTQEEANKSDSAKAVPEKSKDNAGKKSCCVIQ